MYVTLDVWRGGNGSGVPMIMYKDNEEFCQSNTRFMNTIWDSLGMCNVEAHTQWWILVTISLSAEEWKQWTKARRTWMKNMEKF